MMMLNLYQGNLLPSTSLRGIGRRHIIRVQVAGDKGRLNIKKPLKMPDLTLIALKSFQIFQVADMLALENIAFL